MLPAGWILLGLLGAAPETPMDQLEVTATAVLDADSLRVTTTVVNRGPASMPVCVKVNVTARAVWIRADTGEEVSGGGFLIGYSRGGVGDGELTALPESTAAADSVPKAVITLNPCTDLVMSAGDRWVDSQVLPVDSGGLLRPESITVTAAATFRAPTDAERRRTWTVKAEPILIRP